MDEAHCRVKRYWFKSDWLSGASDVERWKAFRAAAHMHATTGVIGITGYGDVAKNAFIRELEYADA